MAGLIVLRERPLIAPLSNGNVSLLVDLAKRAGLPWDAILSAELARHYKPDPEIYLTAVSLLDLLSNEVMMVAAHSDDLRAASVLGLRTAYVHRSLEWEPQAQTLTIPDETEFELVTASIEELADPLI